MKLTENIQVVDEILTLRYAVDDEENNHVLII